MNAEKIWIVTQFIFEKILAELDDHFSRLHIRYMPIKGAYLICTGLAGKMQWRQMSDIDILVDENLMHKATDYFSTLPNVKLLRHFTANYRATESVFSYSSDQYSVTLEIQSALNIPERFVLSGQTLFSDAQQSTQYRFLPSPVNALLIGICHLQSHIPFEFRETWLEEIHLIIEQKQFDWNSFWGKTRPTGIESFIYFILRIYEKRYAVQLPKPRKFRYANALATAFSITRYNRLPLLTRRILFDIPFVRSPLGLIVHRIGSGTGRKGLG